MVVGVKRAEEGGGIGGKAFGRYGWARAGEYARHSPSRVGQECPTYRRQSGRSVRPTEDSRAGVSDLPNAECRTGVSNLLSESIMTFGPLAPAQALVCSAGFSPSWLDTG